MSKKLTDLQAMLEKAKTRPAASLPAVAVRKASSGRPARDGKIHVGAYLPREFRSSLRLVQAQTGDDTQTIIARALNELFRAHNVPVIDG